MSHVVSPAHIRRLPKAELHVHLDGSVRPETLVELAADAGVALPASTPGEIARYMHVRDAHDLTDYLARFRITLSVMQTAAALDRIVHELCEDAAAETVRYMEVRFSPVLHTEGGLPLDQVMDAVLRGLRRGETDFGIRCGLIVCAIRSMEPSVSETMADLAVAYAARGVVGFDLAGAEVDYPAARHRVAFDRAAAANLPITIHAGEAFGPGSIHQAVHRCHARRIGHGVRLREDPALEGFVNDFRIPLELCPTSNVQTRAVPDLEHHPIRRYYDLGLVVTVNTDNRLMSATSLSQEYQRLHERLSFDWGELCDLALMGFEAAFLPRAGKLALLEEARREIALLGQDGEPPLAPGAAAGSSPAAAR